MDVESEQPTTFGQRAKKWVSDLVKGSAPNERDFTSSYAHLLRKEQDGDYTRVGTFVLGLYQLAKEPGGLRSQRFRKAYIEAKKASELALGNHDWSFKHSDLLKSSDDVLFDTLHQFYPNSKGKELKELAKIHDQLYLEINQENGDQRYVEKSQFELAVLDTYNTKRICEVLQEEYDWQNKYGLIPQHVFKVRLMGSWLARLEEADLFVNDEGAQKLTITVKNNKPKLGEEIIHYAMGWLATISTTMAAYAIGTSMLNPIVGMVAAIGAFLALQNADAFDAFDRGEWLWKDLRWILSPNFMTTDKLDLRRSLTSLFLIGSVASVAMLGAEAAFAATMASPLVYTMTPFLAESVSLLASAWSFAFAVIGMTIPLRFIRDLSFHNNLVEPELMHAHRLPEVPVKDLPKWGRLLVDALKQNPQASSSGAGLTHSDDMIRGPKVHILERIEHELELEGANDAPSDEKKKPSSPRAVA